MYAATSGQRIKGAKDTTSHTPGQPQSKREKMTNFSKDAEKLEPSYFAGGNEKWCRPFGK